MGDTMNPQDKKQLYQLLRDHTNAHGAVRTTGKALQAVIVAMEHLRCDDREAVLDLFAELWEVIRCSEPRIIPLIHLLDGVEAELRADPTQGGAARLRDRAIRLLSDKIAHYEDLTAAVIRHGLAHVADNDVILVHSVSAVVTDILLQTAGSAGRKFHVIVLKLDPVRTHQMASVLKGAGVSCSVLPEYSLCHHLEEADKLFMGALSVTRDRKIVAPVGSANLVGLCHANGIRSYLFTNTLHYAHGHATSQQIHKTETCMVHARTNYPLTNYSHDLVDLGLIDVLVNEHGSVSPLDFDGLSAASRATPFLKGEGDTGFTPCTCTYT
jgi:translation initiation factor eIF-2B subunit alpha